MYLTGESSILMGTTSRIHADFIHLVALYGTGNAARFFGGVQGKISYNSSEAAFQGDIKNDVARILMHVSNTW